MEIPACTCALQERAGLEAQGWSAIDAERAAVSAAGAQNGRSASQVDASPPRRKRQRHDSPDASPPRKQRHDTLDASPPRRRRNDGPDASPPRRQKHDSPDASPPRKQRHDSPASPPRRQRHDSFGASPPRRRRHDSSSESPPPRPQVTLYHTLDFVQPETPAQVSATDGPRQHLSLLDRQHLTLLDCPQMLPPTAMMG